MGNGVLNFLNKNCRPEKIEDTYLETKTGTNNLACSLTIGQFEIRSASIQNFWSCLPHVKRVMRDRTVLVNFENKGL